MFRRRQKPSLPSKLRGFVWPQSGWRRSFSYIFHRLARLPGTPYTLAGGFACGAAISFTPFVGLHFILGGIWAWIMRANILSSAIGTAVGNPWTFPFIWVWIYETGKILDPFHHSNGTVDPDFAHLFSQMIEATLKFNFAVVAESGWPIFRSMLIGSVPTVIVTWFAFYWALRPLIKNYQHNRIQRRTASLKKEEEAK
ncbi:MAG: DUF2062 domain-containing protein [Rhodospirillaceae bacterium]|jgi:hypothetical protein|nr:DUF2062 domain-containing protein [Rhodospirillales bacterium]MBT3907403.1 DUF2062 domain-containing protein [Rhodospirillaceae bacterium]MBT4701708.1 DUF2062 domain-containing protein [Rhodospirillaceae bacterium]MBT5035314.1 DUF2062 domain-containing protein [Rhodospirillaceae bacterium]MBT6221848.1 DUF2062 domain-containing protein [Rhodospirillaceae bacterium]